MVAVAEQKTASILAVQPGQEVVVTRRNSVGILFQISTLLSDNEVNILGMSAGVCGEDCLIRLITDDQSASVTSIPIPPEGVAFRW
jgi:hypothetical protein